MKMGLENPTKLFVFLYFILSKIQNDSLEKRVCTEFEN